MSTLLYLHGFNSSPRSAKATQFRQWLSEHHPDVEMIIPQLPPYPAEAAEMLESIVLAHGGETFGVVGSSLGGYYASYVAQRKGCKSVLLNPAVAPDETLAQYIDSHQPLWHQPANAQEEAIFFRAEYIDELRALSVRALPPGGPELGIFCTGDEVLDWREMVQRYPQAQQRIVQGGDHAISDFATLVPEVLSFLELP